MILKWLVRRIVHAVLDELDDRNPPVPVMPLPPKPHANSNAQLYQREQELKRQGVKVNKGY